MKTLLILSTVCMLFTGCNINDDSEENQLRLPNATQTGANTFGCYIDKQLFIPRDGKGTFNNKDRGMIFWGGGTNNEYNEIDVHDYKSERTSNILIHIQGLRQIGVGEYVINESNGQNMIDGLNHTYIHCRVWREDVGNYQNYLSYENSGAISITSFDTISGIISGTFSGKVRNFHAPNDTIQVTQGRFDINGFSLPNTEFP